MKIYNNQKEVDKDLINGTLKVNGDVRFGFNVIKRFNIDAGNIIAGNIDALNIIAGNIIALNIIAGNIIAHNIDALNLDAVNIDVCNIIAHGINARNIACNKITCNNIYAGDIDAFNIIANKISYYAFCISYQNIKCTKIEGRRKNSFHKCLDGKLIIKPKIYTIKIAGKEIEISEESYQEFKEQFTED